MLVFSVALWHNIMCFVIYLTGIYCGEFVLKGFPAKKQNNKKKYKERSRVKRQAKYGSIPFLVPSVIGACVFFFIPFLVVIRYSMLDNPLSGNFVGLENYRLLIENGAYRKAVHNTAMFSVYAVPLGVVLSLLLAMLMDLKLPFRSGFRSFFLSPMMVPVASVVLIWQVLFDYNGAVNAFLSGFGAEKVDYLKSGKAIAVIVILFLWKNLGYNMILFLAALSSIPQDIIEVAILESASPLQIFFRIKLRYLAGTFVFVTIMTLINSFKIFREVYLLTTDYPYETIYMLQHYINNRFRNLDYQALSAAAILMSLVMIVIIAILFVAEGLAGKDLEG